MYVFLHHGSALALHGALPLVCWELKIDVWWWRLALLRRFCCDLQHGGWKETILRLRRGLPFLLITWQKEVTSWPSVCPLCSVGLQQSGWREPFTLAYRGGTHQSNLTLGLSLAELRINIAALQGLNIYSKSKKIRGLQARKVLIYSGSQQWDGHGEVVPEGQ